MVLKLSVVRIPQWATSWMAGIAHLDLYISISLINGRSSGSDEVVLTYALNDIFFSMVEITDFETSFDAWVKIFGTT